MKDLIQCLCGSKSVRTLQRGCFSNRPCIGIQSKVGIAGDDINGPSFASLAAALVAFLLSGAQGEGDNFRFKYWSESKPGSWVRMKNRSVDPQLGGVNSLQKVELVEVAADKVTLTSSVAVILIEGLDPQYSKPERFEHKKKDSPEGVLKEGAGEEIEIAGKKMKCRTFTCQVLESGVVSNKKFWVNTDVPGGIVRMDLKPAAGKGFEVTSVVEAWERK